jgi:hypothetical protein
MTSNMTPQQPSDAEGGRQIGGPPMFQICELQGLSGRDVASLRGYELDVLEYFLARGRREGVFVAVVNTTPASELEAARDLGWDATVKLLTSHPSIVTTSFAQAQELARSGGFQLLVDEYGALLRESSPTGMLFGEVTSNSWGMTNVSALGLAWDLAFEKQTPRDHKAEHKARVEHRNKVLANLPSHRRNIRRGR